jgi:hypothetical protein
VPLAVSILHIHKANMVVMSDSTIIDEAFRHDHALDLNVCFIIPTSLFCACYIYALISLLQDPFSIQSQINALHVSSTSLPTLQVCISI